MSRKKYVANLAPRSLGKANDLSTRCCAGTADERPQVQEPEGEEPREVRVGAEVAPLPHYRHLHPPGRRQDGPRHGQRREIIQD